LGRAAGCIAGAEEPTSPPSKSSRSIAPLAAWAAGFPRGGERESRRPRGEGDRERERSRR
jgi:hypothetical protein